MVYGNLAKQYIQENTIINEAEYMDLLIEERANFVSLTESIEVLDIIQEGKVGTFLKGIIDKIIEAFKKLGKKFKTLFETLKKKIIERKNKIIEAKKLADRREDSDLININNNLKALQDNDALIKDLAFCNNAMKELKIKKFESIDLLKSTPDEIRKDAYNSCPIDFASYINFDIRDDVYGKEHSIVKEIIDKLETTNIEHIKSNLVFNDLVESGEKVEDQPIVKFIKDTMSKWSEFIASGTVISISIEHTLAFAVAKLVSLKSSLEAKTSRDSSRSSWDKIYMQMNDLYTGRDDVIDPEIQKMRDRNNDKINQNNKNIEEIKDKMSAIKYYLSMLQINKLLFDTFIKYGDITTKSYTRIYKR